MKQGDIVRFESDDSDKAHSEDERDEILMSIGWSACFNAWWKYKDDGLDFRQMETKMCEALQQARNELAENCR